MTAQQTTPRAAAMHLWRLGANITAIPVGEKAPVHKWNSRGAQWTTERQPLEFLDSFRWRSRGEWSNGALYPPIETVGIINGIADWRTLDVDAVASPDGSKVAVPDAVRLALLAALGLPDGYAWCGPSKSGKGFHVHVRCAGELPEDIAAAVSERGANDGGGPGVKVGVPVAAYAGAFDHIELRWERCQSVLPSPTGYNGHIPDEPPAEVSVDQVVAAFRAVAAPKQRKAAQVATPPAPRVRTARDPYDGPDVIGEFNRRVSVAEVLERNGYDPTPDGWAHPRTSQPGVTGVRLAGDGKAQSFSATDPLNDGHNHDAFDCMRILEHGGDGKAAYRAGARDLGIALQAPAPRPALAPSAPGDAEPERTTDLGNARRLVRLFGERIRYVHTWGAWLVWDGTRWVKDETGEIHRLARETVRAMYGEAAALSDSAARKELAGWATKSESAGKLAAMVELAQSEPGIAVHHADLDADPWLLNCRNGTVNLRTGELQPHGRVDLITKRVDVDYGADAPAPTWARFMARITSGDADLAGYMQRAVGYTLTGVVREQCLFFCYGNGQNGKSTFVEALSDLLGNYWLKAPTEMLMQQRNSGGIPNDVARLPGARMVVASEVAEGRRLDESKVKDLTGGDTLVARFMKQEFFEFRPVFKLWMYGNHKPVIRGTDNGIWRRIRVLPFTATIPDSEKDPALPDKLRAELPGILAWAVRGCIAWQRDGLTPPAVVQAATEAYRSEMDVVGAFLDECCTQHSMAKAQATQLYQAYRTWCEGAGEYPTTQKQFGERLAARGFTSKRTNKGFWWFGVGLLAPREGGESDPSDPSEPKNEVPASSAISTGDPEKRFTTDHGSLIGEEAPEQPHDADDGLRAALATLPADDAEDPPLPDDYEVLSDFYVAEADQQDGATVYLAVDEHDREIAEVGRHATRELATRAAEAWVWASRQLRASTAEGEGYDAETLRLHAELEAQAASDPFEPPGPGEAR